MQLIEGAEAKAFYGLALNYKPFQALVERLLVKETLSGKEVAETLEGAGVHHFPDPYVEGFLWGEDGGLRYPGMPTQASRSLPTSYKLNPWMLQEDKGPGYMPIQARRLLP